MDDKGSHCVLRRSTRRKCVNNQAREPVHVAAKKSTSSSPRRRLNAFFWFRKVYGKQLDDTHPRESEKCRALADMWKTMSSLERQPYVLMSRRRRWGGPIHGVSSSALGSASRFAIVSGGNSATTSEDFSSVDLSQDSASSAVANEAALAWKDSPSDLPSGMRNISLDMNCCTRSPQAVKATTYESADSGFVEERGTPYYATREEVDTGRPIFEPAPMRPAHSSALLALRDVNSSIFWSPTVLCEQSDEAHLNLDLGQASKLSDSNTRDNIPLTADNSASPFSLFSGDVTPGDTLDVFKQEQCPFSIKVADIDGIFCEAAHAEEFVSELMSASNEWPSFQLLLSQGSS